MTIEMTSIQVCMISIGLVSLVACGIAIASLWSRKRYWEGYTDGVKVLSQRIKEGLAGHIRPGG